MGRLVRWGGVGLIAVATAAWVPAVALGQAAGTAGAATFTEGQKIEVREGDVWSPATLIRREGRRYQVRYGDGTEEWVGADRLRAAGAGTTDGQSQETAAAPGAAPA